MAVELEGCRQCRHRVTSANQMMTSAVSEDFSWVQIWHFKISSLNPYNTTFHLLSTQLTSTPSRLPYQKSRCIFFKTCTSCFREKRDQRTQSLPTIDEELDRLELLDYAILFASPVNSEQRPFLLNSVSDSRCTTWRNVVQVAETRETPCTKSIMQLLRPINRWRCLRNAMRIPGIFL